MADFVRDDGTGPATLADQSSRRFSRVMVIGDVGGHRWVLRHMLAKLGIDVEGGTIPEDTCIIQVGDLVGGGQEDAGLVEDVDCLIQSNPGRWVQLVGNWEARHVGGPVFGHRRRDRVELPEPAVKRLQAWWKTGTMVTAATVRSERGGEALITHAGVGREFWLTALKGERDVRACAQRLGELAVTRPGVVFRPGLMLDGSLAKGAPGPVWAEAAREVWASWAGHHMPFHQIHGHTAPYYFRGQRWHPEVPESLREHATLYEQERHVWWTDGDHRIVGIDPGLGMKPRAGDLVPLSLCDAWVTVS